jgi:hypothetical protein
MNALLADAAAMSFCLRTSDHIFHTGLNGLFVEGIAHLLIGASSLFGSLVIEKYHCVSECGQQFWRKEMSEKEFSKIMPATSYNRGKKPGRA